MTRWWAYFFHPSVVLFLFLNFIFRVFLPCVVKLSPCYILTFKIKVPLIQKNQLHPPLHLHHFSVRWPLLSPFPNMSYCPFLATITPSDPYWFPHPDFTKKILWSLSLLITTLFLLNQLSSNCNKKCPFWGYYWPPGLKRMVNFQLWS